jgi:hypothetical protein
MISFKDKILKNPLDNKFIRNDILRMVFFREEPPPRNITCHLSHEIRLSNLGLGSERVILPLIKSLKEAYHNETFKI